VGKTTTRGRVGLALVFSLAGALWAFAASEALGPQPGPAIGVVQAVEKGAFRIDLDPASGVFPQQVQGQLVVVRRLLREVYLLQSYRRLAAEWQEVAVGRVLPIARTGGAPLALVLWQDQKNPVKAGDRVELCRAPLELLRPQIEAVRCRPLWRRKAETTVAAPGEVLRLEATVICPTGEPVACTWEVDAGEFVHAGGWPAGRRLEAGWVVRWRAPAAVADRAKAKFKVVVKSRWAALTNEARFEVAVREPRGKYAPARLLRTTFDGRPPFAAVSAIAPGPGGSLYVADNVAGRLVHWLPRNFTFQVVGKGAVAALAGGEAAWFVREGALMRWRPGAKEPERVASLPETGRVAGLCRTGAGDLVLLDNSAPPRLHILEGEDWKAADLGLGSDAPFLNAFAIEPRSEDAFVADSRDKVLRCWRALRAGVYRPAPFTIMLGREIDRLGKVVAVVPRDRWKVADELPVSVVFANGAVTTGWKAKGEPPAWQPSGTSRPRELLAMDFAARCGAGLADGDIVVGGSAKAGEKRMATLVELSPAGEFRRSLPLPPLPPRGVAATADGRCFVLLVQPRWGPDLQRVVLVGPEGWVVRDLGELPTIEEISRIRPDAASPNRCFVIGRRKKRQSAFRLDANDPSRILELSYTQILKGSVPDHVAVDVASSPEHIAVLDRDGRVLVFSNTKPIAYLGEFKTGLRRPRAIALFSNVPSRAPGGGSQSFVCVLPSGRGARSFHLWRFTAQPGSKLVAVKVGAFPNPEAAPRDALLSSPVGMATGFPDKPTLLYVLDRGGKQLRVFDVARLAGGAAGGQAGTVALSDLPLSGDALDLSVGCGQVVYIADGDGGVVHVFRRAP